MERISVVIPCFNAADFIRETLFSVLAQTHLPTEIIVVDDGSTDGSAEIAARIDRRIRVIRQANAGESRARNVGIDAAVGEWIALLDADDLWMPEKLEAQLHACAGQPDIVCCHTGLIWQYEGFSEVAPTPHQVIEGDYSVQNVLRYLMVHPSSALIRRSTKVRFPEWTRHGEDALFFADLCLAGRFAFVPDCLVRYRKHPASQSADVRNIVRCRESSLEWLRLRESQLPEQARVEVRRALMEDMLDRLRILKWKRDWKRYWPVREFLQKEYAQGAGPAEIRERIWPPTVYWLKDRVDQLKPR